MFESLKQGLSLKAKVIIALILLALIGGGSLVGYKLWDYKENNPNFCMGCHLMQTAFNKWSVSVHNGVNCHECHHLSFKEQNELMITLILHNPKTVPARHGKVIVPWNFCVKCHWETNEKYPNAVNISRSAFHAKHFFGEQIQCSKCHGYKLHEFMPEPHFCVNCHPDHTNVHGMETLACLNCHNDRASNLLPARDNCLACHGSASQRPAILAELEKSSLIYIKPTADEIAKASKFPVTFPSDGAMQFECYKCHNPHGKILPVVSEKCVECHDNIKKTGMHAVHLEQGLNCIQCHKPHLWKVTPAMAKSAFCTQCHEAKNPADFLK